MSKKWNNLRSMSLKFAGVIGVTLLATARPAAADDIGTAFTYQGELLQGGAPVDEPLDGCDFEFTLWTLAVGGTQLGPTLTPTVAVSDGRFTEVLDFEDDKFQGSPRFLQIKVCCPTGCAPLVALDPRQELTPVPYALALPAMRIQPSGDASFPESPNVIGGTHGNTVSFGVAGGTISGGGSAAGAGINSVTNDFATVSGGQLNTASGARSTVGGGFNNKAMRGFTTVGGGDENIADGSWATVAGGWRNEASGALGFNAATVGGGKDNTARGAKPTVGGGENNTADGDYDTVGGGRSNIVSADYGTIAGGGETTPGDSTTGNRVFDNYGTVGGGGGNKVGSDDGNSTNNRYSTVGGGLDNTARGSNCTVGGGVGNFATGLTATVAGGSGNIAFGDRSFVGGGVRNVAAGANAAVLGGFENAAQADRSVAGGTRALVESTDVGTFVWSDSTTTSPDLFASTGPNQFLINATGGVGIGTAFPGTSAAGDNALTVDAVVDQESLRIRGSGSFDELGSIRFQDDFFDVSIRNSDDGFLLITAPTGVTVVADLFVFGTLSKVAGAFKIDHPLDPKNKYLMHSFVESPDMMNIYNGIVRLDEQGGATVALPDWFKALNKDFRYQLTPIGAAAPNLHIAEEVADNRFSIAGGKPGLKVSWELTGIRQDAWANVNRIPVEVDKDASERGRYLYPEAFGAPSELGIHYRPGVVDKNARDGTGAVEPAPDNDE